MSNPFPGMDPYLEGNLWPVVHANLGTEISRSLNPNIRPKFVARTKPFEVLGVPHYAIDIQEPRLGTIVTAIRILSPTTKVGAGLDVYRFERQTILAGPINLVEIDLLRGGERFPDHSAARAAHYGICVSRAENRGSVLYWPFTLTVPLPTIPVPLVAGTPDAVLDLQSIVSALHEVMRYEELVNYRLLPPGPLSSDDLAWIDERLRAAGKRS